MAEEFNSCAKLANEQSITEAKKEYKKILKSGGDPLEVMLKMQHKLQEALYEKLPDQTFNINDLDTIGKKYDFLRENKVAFDDEFSELVDSLPGMSLNAKDRSALWKRWKAGYKKIRNIKFSELSEEDQKEAKYEIIDMWHFMCNCFLAMDLSGEDIFEYYYTKNAENFRRYNSDY